VPSGSFIGQAWVQIAPSFTGFQQQVTAGITAPMKAAGEEGGKAAAEGANASKSSFANLGAVIAGSLAVKKIVDFGKSVVSAATDAKVANKDLALAFQNSGDATGQLADHAIKLADAWARQTGIQPTVIKNAEGILATFKNVSDTTAVQSGVFDRATKAAGDLAAAGFGDMETNAKSLGKALNDPIKYMGTLTRSGVALTASQQAQIKSMVQQGDLLGAQKQLLSDVEQRVGGMAAQTATGGAKMQVAFTEVKENLGKALLPALGEVFGAIAKLFDFVSAHSAVFTPLIIIFGVLAGILLVISIVSNIAAIGIGSYTVGSVVAAAATWLWNAALVVWNVLMSPVTLIVLAVVAAIAVLIAIVYVIYRNWNTIWGAIVDALKTAWNAIVGAFQAAWNWVSGFLAQWWPLLLGLAGPIGLAVGLIIKYWSQIYAFLLTVWGYIYAYVVTPFVVAWNWVYAAFAAVINAIVAAWNWVAAVFSAVWATVIHVVIVAFQTAVSWAWAYVFSPIFSAITGAFSAMGAGIAWVYNTVILPIFNAFKLAIATVRDAVTAAVTVIGSVWSGIQNAVAAPARFVAFKIINPLVSGANHLLGLIGLSIPLIPAFAEGGKVPGVGSGDKVLARLEPGEWVLTKRQAQAIGYSELANLPRYREGGYVSGGPGGYEPISPRFHLPGTNVNIGSSPVSWGKALVGVAVGAFSDLYNLVPDQIRDPVTHLFRRVATDAFNAVSDPLVKLLTPVASEGPPDFFTGALARFALTAIQKLKDFIEGKTEQVDSVVGAISSAVIGNAQSALGRPYVWGARGPGSFDCSGLIDWSFGTSGTRGQPNYPTGWTGPRVGPTTAEQSVLGKQVNAANPGDLWFFGNPIHHVALALGGENIIHAPQTGDVVRLATVWHTEPTMIRQILQQVGNVSAPKGGAAAWRSTVVQAFGLLGKPANDDWVNAVLLIINGESGGNPQAVNLTDSNAKAGHPSQGLMQVIPSTFLAYVPASLAARGILDPLANIAAGIMYAFSRYGNVMFVPGVRAVAAGGKYVGYQQGGRIPGGWGGGDIIPALLEPGEFVLTKYQARSIGYDRLDNLPRYQMGGWVGQPPPIANNGRWQPPSSGPALVVQNAVFNDPTDVSLLMAQAEFAVRAGRL
jgi:hypothetical protein